MNKAIIFLLSVLSIAFIPQTDAQESESSYFIIQLGVYENPQIENFSALNSEGFVYAEDEDQELQRIFLSGFDQKKSALRALSHVKKNGFEDAFIIENKESDGVDVFVIQLTSHSNSGQINWDELLKARPLFSYVEKGNIRIGGGQYGDYLKAKEDIDYVNSLGFKDAFVKKVNTSKLHKVTSFEMMETKAQIPVGMMVYFEKPKVSDTQDVLVARGVVPTSYENTSDQLVPKSVKIPSIRTTSRRHSVAELQKVLQLENKYNNGLDGMYGPATNSAVKKIMTENSSFEKYKLLSSLTAKGGTKQVSELQAAINSLPFQPEQAAFKLDNISDPVAKAYKAYYLYQRGMKSEVNRLMNDAIQETFIGKKMRKNVPPFDYTASYSYNNLDQLILHLRYIQGASNNGIAAPCWLFQKHPTEAVNAFEPFEFMTPQEYEVEDCGNFMEWESIKLLKTIAADLDPNEDNKNEEIAAQYENKRARHYVAPKPLSQEQTAAVKIWNESLWNGLNEWANQDQVHRKWIVPLKVSYFQSQVLLEDFFINRGFTEKESTALALSTLQTIVAQHLDGYL